MPMLKTISAHNSCSNIMRYLEKDDRAITRDFNNLCDRSNWAGEMDLTRELLGHNKYKNSISYRHYIYSPDPWDNTDIDTVRICANEWAQRHFSDCQWTVITHSDSGKVHAHVVVNSSNLATGNKVQISNGDVIRLAQSAQEIAAAHNLTPLPDLPLEGKTVKRTMPVRITKGEQRLISLNRSCYKMNIRDAADTAVYYSDDVQSFKDVMYTLFNIKVYESRSGFTFVCPDDKNKAASRSLGEAYTVEGISRRYGSRSLNHRADLPKPKPCFIADNFINLIKVKSLALKESPDLYKLQLLTRKENINSVSEFFSRVNALKNKRAEVSVEIENIDTKLKPLLNAEYHLSRKHIDRDSVNWLEQRGINHTKSNDINNLLVSLRSKKETLTATLNQLVAVENKYKEYLSLLSKCQNNPARFKYKHSDLYGTPITVHKGKNRRKYYSSYKTISTEKQRAYLATKQKDKDKPISQDMRRIKAIQQAKKTRKQKGSDIT